MTLYLSNRDGNGKTSEEGHYKFQTAVWTGSVLGSSALAVAQNSPLGMSVLVAPGQFKIDTTSDYSYTGWNTTSTSVAISTADLANPRITCIVIYIDKSEATSPSPPNNPNIPKLMSVNGTPGAIPVAPSSITIQAAVGAGNPYVILANVTVGALATQILNANISDQRSQITIGAGLVSTSSIQDSAINTVKIAASAVTNDKIADNTITGAKLAGIGIDDSKWRNGIAFYAQRTATRNLAAGTWTKIAAHNIVYNYGNGYSNTADIGRFTAPVNGVYLLNAGVYTEVAVQTRAILAFWINGGERNRVRDDTATAIRRMNGTVVMHLNAGDYVEPHVWLGAAANINHPTETWFSGHIVSRT